jgi:uncharacterized repeat protein (TIGR03803 family)
VNRSHRFICLVLTAAIILTASSSLAAAQQFNVIHIFGKTAGDGLAPWANLVSDKYGNLYGTTAAGGTFNNGAVFELIKPTTGGLWTEQVLYSFGTNPGDGSFPQAGVIFDPKGNLYGTTFYGTGSSSGTVFELSPPATTGAPWTETLLYSFSNTGGNTGSGTGGLVFGKAGVLYGLDVYGGEGYGTAFELHPPAVSGGAWTEKRIFLFNRINGEEPEYECGSLTPDASGNFYAEAIFGGKYDGGLVFELSPPIGDGSWTETELFNLGNVPDGPAGAIGKVVFDEAGNIYGTTTAGGTHNDGTVFEISPPAAPGDPWTETTIHSFDGTDGNNLRAGVVFDKSGNLYGTTFGPQGTVFELSPPSIPGGEWTETTLHTFTGSNDGGQPYAGLYINSQGIIFGTTSVGGGNCVRGLCGGVAFEIKP